MERIRQTREIVEAGQVCINICPGCTGRCGSSLVTANSSVRTCRCSHKELGIVFRTRILRPSRSSLVTTSTSPGSRRSRSRGPAPLRGSDVARDRLGDDTPGLDLEAGCCDLLQLVFGGLTDGGDAEVSEGVRHGRFSFKKDVRNLPLFKSLSSYLLNGSKERCP